MIGCLECINSAFLGQKKIFFVRVFNPFAKIHVRNTLPHETELEKKHAYDTRVREVEHGSFSPLVFSYFWRSRANSHKCIAAMINRMKPTVKLLFGFVAILVFHCYAQQSCASVGLDRRTMVPFKETKCIPARSPNPSHMCSQTRLHLLC